MAEPQFGILEPVMVDGVAQQQEALVGRLKEGGASLVGFGDVSAAGSELTARLPVAISLGVKYDERIVENLHVDEASFHNHLLGLNAPVKRLLGVTEGLLWKWGYDYEVPPVSVLIESDEQLRRLNSFPHKTAATCAGLGWVGKCSLLVTPEYGPRLRLATILTSAPFKTAQPIAADRCGECTLCVEACPYEAIHNVNWKRGLERDRLFDAYMCNGKRAGFIPTLGRKHSCALCLQACRIGKGTDPTRYAGLKTCGRGDRDV